MVFVSQDELLNNSTVVQDIVNYNNRKIITIPNMIKQEVSGKNDVAGKKMVDIQNLIIDNNENFKYKFVEYDNLLD